MMLAYEFKDPTMQSVLDMSPEVVGEWLAFFKYKNELENTPTKKRPTKPGRG